MKLRWFVSCVGVFVSFVCPVLHSGSVTQSAQVTLSGSLTTYLSNTGFHTEAKSATLPFPRFAPSVLPVHAASVVCEVTSTISYQGNVFTFLPQGQFNGVNGNVTETDTITIPGAGANVSGKFHNQTTTLSGPMSTFVPFSIGYPTQVSGNGPTPIASNAIANYIGTGSVPMPLSISFKQETFASNVQVIGAFSYSIVVKVTVTLENGPLPITDLGGGTPGVSGIPLLSATGALVPASNLNVVLANAAPSAASAFFAALDPVAPIPYLGGTLHAIPFQASIFLSTNSTGDVSLTTAWPGVPSGISVVIQMIVSDGASPGGAALSNALRLIGQ
jgi:hypothetical protein